MHGTFTALYDLYTLELTFAFLGKTQCFKLEDLHLNNVSLIPNNVERTVETE